MPVVPPRSPEKLNNATPKPVRRSSFEVHASSDRLTAVRALENRVLQREKRRSEEAEEKTFERPSRELENHNRNMKKLKGMVDVSRICYHEYYDWGYCVILEAFLRLSFAVILYQEETPKGNGGESIVVSSRIALRAAKVPHAAWHLLCRPETLSSVSKWRHSPV